MTLSLPSPCQPPSASLLHIEKPRLKCHVNVHLQQKLRRVPGNSPTSSQEIIKPVSFQTICHLGAPLRLQPALEVPRCPLRALPPGAGGGGIRSEKPGQSCIETPKLRSAKHQKKPAEENLQETDVQQWRDSGFPLKPSAPGRAMLSHRRDRRPTVPFSVNCLSGLKSY